MDIHHQFTIEEAGEIGKQLGIDWKRFDVEQFHKGLNIELEHGLRQPETSLTNNNPLLIGKIVLGHLLEFPDYYTRLENMKLEAQKGTTPVPHYHGRLIRKIFMVAAVALVIGLPFAGPSISILGFISILAVLLLGITAGLTSPDQKGVLLFDMVISVLGFMIFEVYAIASYNNSQAFAFVLSEALALMFLTAIYYSTKTWRGMMVK